MLFRSTGNFWQEAFEKRSSWNRTAYNDAFGELGLNSFHNTVDACLMLLESIQLKERAHLQFALHLKRALAKDKGSRLRSKSFDVSSSAAKARTSRALSELHGNAIPKLIKAKTRIFEETL